MQYTEHMSNESLLGIIRRSCNCVDSRLMDHGARVAYIASRMLLSLGKYNDREMRDICLLCLVHDIGAYKTEEISQMLKFETDNAGDHSIYGHLFIKYFSPLRDLADAVLFHHFPWDSLCMLEDVSEKTKELSQLIHIADRIDVARSVELLTWEQTKEVLLQNRGGKFSPDMAALAAGLELPSIVEADSKYNHILLDIPFTQDEITEYLKMIIFAIDFRSRYTVTHTITTANLSSELAKYMGIDEAVKNQIICGALLHDLGKIGIPVGILENPGALTAEEMNIMRTHVDLTEAIFGGAVDETIQNISLRHHEKLDGTGYPRGLFAKDLSLSERIVAVADIVGALSGIRSYKVAFPKERIISIIQAMKENGGIDPDVVDTMILHFDDIMEENQIQCQPILDIYEGIQLEYEQLQKKFRV